jgi:hypothetical protein
MVSISIKINGDIGSRDDLSLGVPVVLSNDDNTGITSWKWSLISKPEGSATTLSTPTSSTSGFTPDAEGSYLIELTVNGKIKKRIIGAVLTTSGVRLTAVGEANEFGGWGATINESLTIVEAGGGGGGSDLHNVKVTFGDTTPDFLNSKITVTNGIQKSVTGIGNEQLQLQPSYGSASNTVCQGNDSRLSDSRTPLSHAISHKSGQSDAIKLDELAAPTDVTTLNVSTSAHGLCPKLPNDAAKYFNGIGTYTVPATGGSDGYNVKVTITDTTPNFLNSKITVTNGLQKAVTGVGNEQLQLQPSYGSSANTICQGDDSRLTNDRTASGLRSATTVVSVSAAIAPANKQVLTATSSTTATWQEALIDRYVVYRNDDEFVEYDTTFTSEKFFRVVKDSQKPPVKWRAVVSIWVDAGYGDTVECKIDIGGDNVILSTTNTSETIVSGNITITTLNDTPLNGVIQLRAVGGLDGVHVKYTDIYAVF